jgi:hypothetical protein
VTPLTYAFISGADAILLWIEVLYQVPKCALSIASAAPRSGKRNASMKGGFRLRVTVWVEWN